MPPVIISMTTIPARNGTLAPTLGSIRLQRPEPDEIRLYVTPGCDVVAEIAHLAGVRCIQTFDYGPVTKLSAATDASLPEDALIVTADDDTVYRQGWLKTLIEGANEHPGEAVGMSGWNVQGFLADPIAGHYDWARYPETCDILEGFAGAAYRRRFFDHDVLAPPAPFRFVDDVWIGAYLHRRGIARRLVGRKMCQPSSTAPLPGLHNRSDFVELNRRAAVLGFSP